MSETRDKRSRALADMFVQRYMDLGHYALIIFSNTWKVTQIKLEAKVSCKSKTERTKVA